MNQLTIERHKICRSSIAQLQCGRRDRVEHRLYVSLRGGDHLQDLADRRVLFQCLRKALLELHAISATDPPRLPADRRPRHDLGLSRSCAPFHRPSLPIPGATAAHRSTIAYAAAPFRGRPACSVARALRMTASGPIAPSSVRFRANWSASAHGRSATVDPTVATSRARLHLSLLRDLQCVVNLDPKVSDGAFEFGVAE